MVERDPIDRLLDSALASYVQPREDLERRVLEALSMERGQRAKGSNAFRRYWMTLALATAAAAALLSFVLWPSPKYVQRPQVANTLNTIGPPTLVTAAPFSTPHPAQHPTTVRVARRQSATPQKLPKLDIFPTPHPLTPTEQALVLYVSQAPASERQALVEAQQQQNEPIHIAAIEIAPLDFSTSHGN